MRTMQRLLTYTTIVLLLLYPGEIKATNLEHFGGAYLATNVCYGVYKKMFHVEKPASYWFALTCGTLVNLSAEMMDRQPQESRILSGEIGVLTSIFTIKVFDF